MAGFIAASHGFGLVGHTPVAMLAALFSQAPPHACLPQIGRALGVVHVHANLRTGSGYAQDGPSLAEPDVRQMHVRMTRR